MSEQMSFLYVKCTGHVLSVISSVAPLTTPLAAIDIASPSVSVRCVRDQSDNLVPGVRFDLTPDQLEVFTGDKIAAALQEPRSYLWNKEQKKIQAISFVTTVTATNFSSTGFDVDLGRNATAETNVLVAYAGSDPAKSEIASGKVSFGTRKTHVPATPVVSGTYVLLLATGFAPRIAKVP